MQAIQIYADSMEIAKGTRQTVKFSLQQRRAVDCKTEITSTMHSACKLQRAPLFLQRQLHDCGFYPSLLFLPLSNMYVHI